MYICKEDGPESNECAGGGHARLPTPHRTPPPGPWRLRRAKNPGKGKMMLALQSGAVWALSVSFFFWKMDVIKESSL